MKTCARLIGSPAATARSQKPLTSASSGSPLRPALASHAVNALMSLSFMAGIVPNKRLAHTDDGPITRPRQIALSLRAQRVRSYLEHDWRAPERFHIGRIRSGRRVASFRMGAESKEAADWASRQHHRGRLRLARRFGPQGLERNGLRGGPERYDRIPLGRRPLRTVAGHGRRPRSL